MSIDTLTRCDLHRGFLNLDGFDVAIVILDMHDLIVNNFVNDVCVAAGCTAPKHTDDASPYLYCTHHLEYPAQPKQVCRAGLVIKFHAAQIYSHELLDIVHTRFAGPARRLYIQVRLESGPLAIAMPTEIIDEIQRTSWVDSGAVADRMSDKLDHSIVAHQSTDIVRVVDEVIQTIRKISVEIIRTLTTGN